MFPQINIQICQVLQVLQGLKLIMFRQEITSLVNEVGCNLPRLREIQDHVHAHGFNQEIKNEFITIRTRLKEIIARLSQLGIHAPPEIIAGMKQYVEGVDD
jgi:hypothetical protein